MDIEQAREYALTMPGATEDLPFGPDVLTIRIAGKIFMAMGLDSEEPKVTVKLKPAFAEGLRERHDGVRPAFHWNKKHWSDLYLNELDDMFVKDLIATSYRIVVSKLPKKTRENLIVES